MRGALIAWLFAGLLISCGDPINTMRVDQDASEEAAVDANDASIEDAPSDDADDAAGDPDMGTPDMGTPDMGTPDMGTPDMGVDPPPEPQLTIRNMGDRLIAESNVHPSWRAVFGLARNASSGSVGGGVVQELYIPADNAESIVETRPGAFCCSGYGVDNLEWRWVPNGSTAGRRHDMGIRSTISNIEVVEDTNNRYTIRIEGSWPDVPSFTKTITITPDGYSAEIDLTFRGMTGVKSMWWLLTLFDQEYIGANAQIRDPDTDWMPLPNQKETIARVPSAINFPYTVRFGRRAPISTRLYLTVRDFADGSNAALNYEWWPATDGHRFFFPRWVAQFQHRDYHFDYSWKFTHGNP